MLIRTKDTERVRFFCPSGQRVELRHRAVIHKDGKRELVHDRKKNTWDIIQSHLEECLIENIIRRALEGDSSVLEVMKGTYTDITGAPQSLAEAQQMIIDLKAKFDELPKDIKRKFDYNVEQYIAEFGTDSWAEKTGVADILKKEKEAAEREKNLSENIEKFFSNTSSNNSTTVEEGGTDES